MRSNWASRFVFLWLVLPVSFFVPISSSAAPGIELLAPDGHAKAARQVVLDAAADPLWQRALVDWMTVRSAVGQRSIAAKELSEDLPIEFELLEQGCVLLLLDLAPSAAAKSEGPLSRSSKLISCRFTEPGADSIAARRQVSKVLTSKVGSRLELRPLLNPAVLKVGSDLPLRAYFEGSSAGDAELLVVAPDGSDQRVSTDSVGIAAVPLDQPGRWRVSFERRAAGASAPSLAELVFEVLTEADWQRLTTEGSR